MLQPPVYWDANDESILPQVLSGVSPRNDMTVGDKKGVRKESWGVFFTHPMSRCKRSVSSDQGWDREKKKKMMKRDWGVGNWVEQRGKEMHPGTSALMQGY